MHGRGTKAAQGGLCRGSTPLYPHTSTEVEHLRWCNPGARAPITPCFWSLSGGGVMGAAGRNAARVALEDFRRL